jgi:hypothetical protein
VEILSMSFPDRGLEISLIIFAQINTSQSSGKSVVIFT